MLQARVAVVEREAPVESLVDLDFGPGEAETMGLLGDLEATTVPLHDIVIADDAFVHETADPFEAFWDRTPGGLLFARLPGETAVVIHDELAQHGVGRVDVVCLGEPQFAGETILEHAPETLDAAFGLWAASGDEGDTELLEGAAELSRLTLSGELFFDRPVVIMAEEDAAAIAVKSPGQAMAAEQLAKQAEIAKSGFRGEELSRQDFTGRVVLHAQSGESWAATFEPVMGTAIQLDQFAQPCGTHAALPMSRGPALSGRAEAVLA